MSDIRKVVLFTGAGASVPLGMPTSTQFVAGIEAGAPQITQLVRSYLGADSSDDIEWILSALDGFNTQTDFTEYLLPQLVVGNSLAERGKEHVEQRLAELRRQAGQELVRLKKLIFEKLSAFEADKAAQLHFGLLRAISTAFRPCAISVVTTNYDLSFETAMENGESELKNLGVNEVEFGFATKFGRPIYDPSRDFGWKPTSLEYLKLHGSLDWHRDAKGRCSRSMSNTVPDDPDQMAILYPGFKGVPEVEPFVSLHGRLSTRLAEADVVIVIGFAFRDAYINSVFENTMRLKPSLRVLNFNPLPLEKHPAGSVSPRFSGAYSAFSHHERPLVLGPEPLPLAEAVAALPKTPANRPLQPTSSAEST